MILYPNLIMLLIFIISYFMIFMIYIKSPLLGSLVLIFISILMSLYVSLLSSKWMSYLIILLFLGGMMVLFVYVCTLISSLKNSVKTSYNWVMASAGLTLLFSNLFYFNNWEFNTEMKNILLSMMYSNSNFLLMILAVVYLLLVLVTSIKISQKFKGGLKSKINEI